MIFPLYFHSLLVVYLPSLVVVLFFSPLLCPLFVCCCQPFIHIRSFDMQRRWAEQRGRKIYIKTITSLSRPLSTENCSHRSSSSSKCLLSHTVSIVNRQRKSSSGRWECMQFPMMNTKWTNVYFWFVVVGWKIEHEHTKICSDSVVGCSSAAAQARHDPLTTVEILSHIFVSLMIAKTSTDVRHDAFSMQAHPSMPFSNDRG